MSVVWNFYLLIVAEAGLKLFPWRECCKTYNYFTSAQAIIFLSTTTTFECAGCRVYCWNNDDIWVRRMPRFMLKDNIAPIFDVNGLFQFNTFLSLWKVHIIISVIYVDINFNVFFYGCYNFLRTHLALIIYLISEIS